MSTGRESAVCGGAGPGDKRRGRAGSSAHTNTTAPKEPSGCSALLASGGGGSPTADRLTAGGVHLTNRGLWLVTHPGEPKALW